MGQQSNKVIKRRRRLAYLERQKDRIKQARAAGCDAVIDIKEAPTPANWTFETRVRHFTGIGIIYK
jgi:hypothetical protein